MASLKMPNENYVGLLQEKCMKNNTNLPVYVDDSESSGKFKWVCKVDKWTTEGVGFTKKIAKQRAAELMIAKLDSENCLNNSLKVNKNEYSAVSKLSIYCSKEKKEIPLFSDNPKEGNDYVVSCTFDGFTSTGKGSTKKIAKENAADSIATKFNVHTYFENLKASEKRRNILKNPTQLLHEFIQPKKLTCEYTEEKIRSELKKGECYVVTCKVGDIVQRSSQNSSKKVAKYEAASLMLDLLKTNTPGSSPKIIIESTSFPLSADEDSSNELPTYVISENEISIPSSAGEDSSDGEPLPKRGKL